jgi:DNA-binding NtrC family response regulator
MVKVIKKNENFFMKKVLIVEDDAVFVPIIEIALRDLNFEMHIAPDGYTALDHLAKTKYDLIISDYRLPEIHGLDILRAAHNFNPACHTMLISAATEQMQDVNLEGLNCLGFIRRPLTPMQIRELVAQVF